MPLDLALTIPGVLLLILVARMHRLLRPRNGVAPVVVAAGPLPSVSVIRPIRGLDAELDENLRAALALDYPGEVETIFVVDGADEPALPYVRAAIRAHEAHGRSGRARVLVAGAPPPGRTGKLNAMIAGLRVARGELVAFADSDIRAAPD